MLKTYKFKTKQVIFFLNYEHKLIFNQVQVKQPCLTFDTVKSFRTCRQKHTVETKHKSINSFSLKIANFETN